MLPSLWLEAKDVANWDLSLGVGPIFASDRYQDYFYSVAPEFATPRRPAYDADRDYSGASILLGGSRRFQKF